MEQATSNRGVGSLAFGGILLVQGLVLGAVEARQVMRRSRPARA